MSTTTHPQNEVFWKSKAQTIENPADNFAAVLVPFGRALFSVLFILNGFQHFSQQTIDYAAQQGVPVPSLLVPSAGIMAILGGLSVLLGFRARIGALILILFLVPVTLMMHAFWKIDDPMMSQMQYSQFLKNLALLGSSILICFFGTGPSSLDSYFKNKPPGQKGILGSFLPKRSYQTDLSKQENQNDKS